MLSHSKPRYIYNRVSSTHHCIDEAGNIDPTNLSSYYIVQGIEPGMIHRDVKSSNFLLDSGGQARIADFGLAIHTGTMSGKTAFQYETPPVKDSDILTGTYGYTSPETIEKGIYRHS